MKREYNTGENIIAICCIVIALAVAALVWIFSFLFFATFSTEAKAQYTLPDMETICAEDFSEAQTIQCTHAQRINLGLWSMDQIDHLIELHNWYRDSSNWDRAEDVTHQIKEIMRHNGWSRVKELVAVLIWVPDGQECFSRHDDGRYTKWTDGCTELRYYVADCYIMATRIAEIIGDWEAVERLAYNTAMLTKDITGQPEYIYDITTGQYFRNANIPNKYRSEYWAAKSRGALKNV